MSDLVERLRERLGRRTVTVSAGLYEDIRDAATALEAKDKELAAIERAFTDVCIELRCKYDNESALEAITALKYRAETAERERDEARAEAKRLNYWNNQP